MKESIFKRKQQVMIPSLNVVGTILSCGISPTNKRWYFLDVIAKHTGKPGRVMISEDELMGA